MKNDMPIGKFSRGVKGGVAATRLLGKATFSKSKRVFLASEKRQEEKERFESDAAKLLFGTLSQLKGTALKIAQLMSLEIELLPEVIRKELSQSFNLAPPINRAVMRQLVFRELGAYPESIFASFDAQAFAAASLGQVHRATDQAGRKLAVKVQYPGVRQTIRSDVDVLKLILRNMTGYQHLSAALREVEMRLLEETDYIHEADTQEFFRRELGVEQVYIPAVIPEYSTEKILCTEYVQGLPLHEWIKTNPAQKERDAVANKLTQIFLTSLYELHHIHADPNPGNFIIMEDGGLALIDFGCSRRIPESFIATYRRLPQTAASGDKEKYKELLAQMNIFVDQNAPDIEDIIDIMMPMGKWIAKAFTSEEFDFKANADHMREGKRLSEKLFKFRKQLNVDPEFVFLDRTRYGLLRLYEQLGAKVRLRNKYEWAV